MRPDARAQSAIDILDHWLQDRNGLDRILTQWARANRYAGSGDRAAIADLVYGAVRRLRSATWASGEDEPTGRGLLHGAALLDEIAPESIFTGARHAPKPLTAEQRNSERVLTDAPHAVRFDYPDWLAPCLDDTDQADLDALRRRAALDLRVNTLKADRDTAIASLRQDEIEIEPVAATPNALRVTAGNRRVARSQAYAQGLVEIQDAGSQQLAELAKAQPGELIIDLCAGGGGKTLALAAATENRARILAHDISKARLSDLPGRAARAGAKVEILDSAALNDWHGRADLVFVDAPCSGSGAWRRNPDAKWTLSAERLSALTNSQAGLLRQAMQLCHPEGRIVYGTCSLLSVENEAVINAFLAEFPEWSCSSQFDARPFTGTDGFFGAVLLRSLDSRLN